MNRDAFAHLLAEQGFTQIVTVEREADGALATHTHPFEAKALIVHGEITLRTDAGTQTYRVGEIFHLPAHCPHAETYGPQGVTYLVGRK